MKKIILACFLTFSVATAAMAGWTETFVATYQEKGIDQAVNGALHEGKTPVLIIEEGLKIEGLNPQNLLMALYCAGADGNDIKKAAEAAGISEVLLVAAYEKSVAECGDQMSDAQPYTPAGTVTPTFAGLPALSSNNSRAGFASPSTF